MVICKSNQRKNKYSYFFRHIILLSSHGLRNIGYAGIRYICILLYICLKQSKMHERQQLKYPIIDFFAVYGHISVLLNSISPPFGIDATAPHTYTHISTHNGKQTNLHITLQITTKDARMQKNNKHVLSQFYLNSVEYISTLKTDLMFCMTDSLSNSNFNEVSLSNTMY